MAHSGWRIPLAALAALGLTSAALQPRTTSADSAIGGLHIMHTVQYDQAHSLGVYAPQSPRLGNNLRYHGGQVMQANSTAYTIFWQPSGTYMDPNYKTLINRYFNDVGGSVVYANNTQYFQRVGGVKQYIQNSVSLGGTWTDTSAYPGAHIQDVQIQAEVTRAMQQNGWTPGPTHLFFVFISKGQDTCIQPGVCFLGGGGFCAYHGYYTNNGQNVFYANMPYVGTIIQSCWTGGKSPNNDVDADAEINVVSHEHNEAVTDSVTTFVRPTGAWYDVQTAEIGDKCAWQFGNVKSNGQNVVMNGNPYIVQLEWSNKVSGCPSWD